MKIAPPNFSISLTHKESIHAKKNQFCQANSTDLYESSDNCHSSATRGSGAESRARLTSGGIFKRFAQGEKSILEDYNCDFRIYHGQKHGNLPVFLKNRKLAFF